MLEITGREWCDLFVWAKRACRCWHVPRDHASFDALMPHYTNFWAAAVCGRTPRNPKDEVPPIVARALQKCVEIEWQQRPERPVFSQSVLKDDTEAEAQD